MSPAGTLTGRSTALARAVFGSSTEAVGRLEGADRSLRAAIPVSRRVAFVATAGGSGCTSAVASLGSLLAHRRRGPVLAVDADGGRSGLGVQLAGPATTSSASTTRTEDDEEQRQADLVRRTARTGAEARQGLTRGTSGLYLLQTAAAGRPGTPADWAAQVGPIARFYDLVLTDWGHRGPAETARLAADSHVTVVVGRADPYSAATAAGVAADLAGWSGSGDRDRDDGADHSVSRPVVLLLVDVARTGAPTAAGLRADLAVPVLVLPYERSRGAGRTPSSRRFAARTRDAHLALAAVLVDRVVAP